MAKFVVELKMSLVEPKEVIKLTNEGYAGLQKYYNDINYWIVYHAMKDFQNEEFQFPDYSEEKRLPIGFYLILKMNHIHKIADTILNYSRAPKEVIKEIFEDERGNAVAELVFYLNVPLTEFSKLTKIQKKFLYYAKNHEVMRGNRKGISVSGENMSYENFLKGLV